MTIKSTSFRRFSTIAQAAELAALLRDHGIHAMVEDDTTYLDSTYLSGRPIHYDVIIPDADFPKAYEVLQEEGELAVEEVAEDHYLYDFTDEELREVLFKSDEWNEVDLALAKRILADRGKPVNEDELETMKARRLAELAKPEKNRPGWIFLGYLFSLTMAAGFLGMVLGFLIVTLKKTLPSGERVYVYTKSDRRHGIFIVLLGIVSMATMMLLAEYGYV